MDRDDIQTKRAILLSARLQFAPETQAIREAAIDRLVEQAVFLNDPSGGLGFAEIREQPCLCSRDGEPLLNPADLRNALSRLTEARRLTCGGLEGSERYAVAGAAAEELAGMRAGAERRLHRIAVKLFGDAVDQPSVYVGPLVRCLCIIFSSLEETYVRVLSGQINGSELPRAPSIARAVAEVSRDHPGVDDAALEAGVLRFFRDADPDYDAVKWNMAQNHYIAIALGVDPSGYLLSREVFGEAVLYLDTNVVVESLAPSLRHPATAKALAQACRGLGIKVAVCRPTLDELAGWAERRRDLVARLAEEVPDEMAPLIDDPVYQLYRAKAAQGEEATLEAAIRPFLDPMPLLVESYGAELVEDPWFAENEDQEDTRALAHRLRDHYRTGHGWSKRARAALHDALLLRWVQRQRDLGAADTWLCTHDLSLPSLPDSRDGKDKRPAAITVNALLHWLSPLAAGRDLGGEVPAAFGEELADLLLPQETFFDLADFQVFASMQIACRELPVEDVEGCIRYLKTQAPGLDPSTPEDRETMARHIARYFADPSRKYKQDIHRLETEARQRQQEHQAEVERLQQESEGRIAQLSQQYKRDIEGLRRELEAREGRWRDEALQASARRRVGVGGVVWLVLEGAAAVAAWRWGEGANWVQKMANSWPLFTASGVAGVLICGLLLGKKRLAALDWPFTKWLGK